MDPKNIHISQKVTKLLREENYTVKINHNPKLVIKGINEYHNNSWISNSYENLLLNLFSNEYDDFNVISYELYTKDGSTLVAAELGYIIGSTYTSLTGFFKKSKEFNNFGKLQMTLLAKELVNRDIKLWNLGHASLQYKLDLGAKILKRLNFLVIWKKFI